MGAERDLIDAAIAQGRVTRIPLGASVKAKAKAKAGAEGEAKTKFHPEHCGKGDRVFRHRFLDEIDGDFS